ncbi:MAG: ubiquinone/menaquinone biosynthesis methyltransferase [Chloroflexi bacterium]|nr:ubiquinone/menaquinone biosynthesis methyltransferase [Chloroflexota bacterium]
MAGLRGRERADYVSSMFGRISKRYDLLNTIMTGGRHHAWRRMAVDLAVGDVAGPALDVATGTGDFALDLAGKDSLTGVYGIDFTPQMLSIAAVKAGRTRLAGKLSLMLGDAHALPFEDESFVCATIGFGVRNFTDLRGALGEVERVLKPGGRLAILEIVRPEGNGVLSRLLPIYFRHVTPLIGALFAADRAAYTYLPESVDEFLSASGLAAMMGDAGLKLVARRSLGLGTVAILVGEKARPESSDSSP